MWHYRSAYTDYAMPDGSTERQWGVVEYYPNEEGDGGGWTGFVKPIGDDRESLVKVLQWMLDDINKRGEEPLEIAEEVPDGS